MSYIHYTTDKVLYGHKKLNCRTNFNECGRTCCSV